MDVLQRIKDLLKERNWSIYRLAQVSGINPSTLGNLFTRNNVPTIPTLERICEALGISLSEFFIEDNTLLPEKQLDIYMEREWVRLTVAQKKVILEVMNQFTKL